MRTPILALASTLLTQALPVSAQGRIVDEGSFTISSGGRMVGRENFRVTSIPRGDAVDYVARGDLTYGDRRLAIELRTDATGAATTYNAAVRVSGSSEKWDGAVARGRLNATIITSRGTAAREAVVAGGAVILDDDIVHHHWFVGVRTRDGRIPVLVPRRDNAQLTYTVSTVGEESLQIGTQDLRATHLRLTAPGDTRDVWIDRNGRLLKVTIPSRGLVATRDDPPPA